MVRVKQRYILCEITAKCGKNIVLPFTEKDVYLAVKDAVAVCHGDYGVGVLQSSLSVKYLNKHTRIVLIRAKRSFHEMLLQSIAFVKQINKVDVSFKTIHVGGSMRSCEKNLVKHHFWNIPKILRECSNLGAEEKKELIRTCETTLGDVN